MGLYYTFAAMKAFVLLLVLLLLLLLLLQQECSLL
jgi:hypothetical protein